MSRTASAIALDKGLASHSSGATQWALQPSKEAWTVLHLSALKSKDHSTEDVKDAFGGVGLVSAF